MTFKMRLKEPGRVMESLSRGNRYVKGRGPKIMWFFQEPRAT